MSYCTYRGELELKCVATATADEKNYNGELVCVGRTRDNTTCKPKSAPPMDCYPGKSPEQMYPGKSGPPGPPPPGPPGKGGDSQYGRWSGYDNYPYGSYVPYGSSSQSSGYPYGSGGRGQMGGGGRFSGSQGGPYAQGAGKMPGGNQPGYNNFRYTRRW